MFAAPVLPVCSGKPCPSAAGYGKIPGVRAQQEERLEGVMRQEKFAAVLSGLAALIAPAFANAGINSWTVVGPEGGNTITVAIHPARPDSVFAQVGGLFCRSTDAGAHWTYLPGSTVGAVSRVGFDPADPDLVIMGSDRIFRSTDGGQNFTTPAGPPVTGGIRQLAMAADGAVYVIDYAAHLFRSQDHGLTWTALDGIWPANYQLSTIEADPNAAARLYVATDAGVLYRSEDRGATWSELTSFPVFLGSGSLSSLAIQRGNSDRILAASFSSGYAVSQDRGATWSFFAFFEPTMWVGFDPITPANAVALTRNGRVYRSADGGLTWPALLNGPSLDAGFALSAAFSPSQPGRMIFATSDGPYVSDNGGATLTPRFAGLHAAYPSAFAAADDGTLYESNQAGPFGIFRRGTNGWTPLNNAGLRAQSPFTLRIDDMAVSASDSNVIYVINQFSDVLRSLDGGISWLPPAAEFAPGFNRHPQSVAVDPSTPDIAYVATYSDGLWKTTNRGAAWTKLTGLPGRVDRIGISPFDPQTVYVSAYDTAYAIYKSTNGGASWAPTGAVRNGEFAGFTFDPVDSETVYAFGGDVNRSTNGGGSWAQLDFGQPYGAFARAQAMMVDPLFSSTLWVVGAQGSSSVLRSVDSGAHWESIRLDVPQGDIFLPLDEAALDPLNPSLIHVGVTLLGIADFEVAPDMFVTFNGLSTPVPADSALNTEVLIANTGPHDSSPGEARLTLPSFINVLPPPDCALNGLVLTCPFPALRIGQIYSLPLALTVDAEPAAEPIQVAITPHETDPVLANNLDARGIQSTRQAPIEFEFINTVPSIARNDSVTFLARITNPGPSRARNVRMDLATGTLKVTDATGPHGACENTIDTVSCQFGTLEANSSVTVSVEAQVSALGENVVTGTASRRGDDAEATDNGAFVIIGRPLADFSIQLTSTPVTVAPGAAVSYVFNVQNAGPDPATGQVRVTMAGATGSGAVTTGGTCSLAGALFTCNLDSLGSGASTAITISATAGSSGSASAAGSVIGGGVDRTAANDNASGTTSIVAPAPPKKSGGGGGRFDWLALALSGLLGLRRIRTRLSL